MRLKEELERVLNYLDSSSEKILIETFLREYIEVHAQTLINMEQSGLIHMIKNEKYNEIALMHDLFSKIANSNTALTKSLA
jgi:cullin 3